jgi:hypothetical protein
MKIVINTCFGGFSLSPRAIKRLAELEGRECYFYRGFKNEELISLEQAEKEWFAAAYDVPNLHEVLPESFRDEDGTYTTYNALCNQHSINSRPEDRTDPKLIQVVEELGNVAAGACAKLRIIEIPDGIEYEIEEYDGMESVHEVHQSWS